MDFSRRFAVIEVPAYDAAQCSYAAQMELFSLGLDLLISHRLVRQTSKNTAHKGTALNGITAFLRHHFSPVMAR
jgi:hypothetical protein